MKFYEESHSRRTQTDLLSGPGTETTDLNNKDIM